MDISSILSEAGLSPKDILAKRICATQNQKPTPANIAAMKTGLNEHAPAMISIRQEINNSNALMQMVVSNIPLLSTAVTAPGAGTAIAAVLPDLVKCLTELGILDLPAMYPFKAIVRTIAATIITVNGLIDPINAAVSTLGICNQLIPPLPPIELPTGF